MTDTISTAPPGQEFWRSVLLGSGDTALPRWPSDVSPGVAEVRRPLPADATPSELLAAAARVLAALSGDTDVVLGYRLDDEPLPCPVATGGGSWRALLTEAERVHAGLVQHRDFPVADLRHELGLERPAFEAVLDADPALGRPLPDGTLLAFGVDCDTLVLRYRTDALDAASGARVAGYLVTSLTQLAGADPAAAHRAESLLGEDEYRYQIDGLAGPERDLPDRRVHELFEDRVRRHPEAVAAVCGPESWTYRELSARANRVARALLARDLGPEAVVGVVTERNLGWMAAVLGVLKSGLVYLPIEPHFPADRIATTLARAGCTLILTEAGSTATLDPAVAALPGVTTLRLDDPEVTGQADGDPGVAVPAGGLAYIYFTSGSTGEPKGGMCEHAGMLNHVLAKIEDLGLHEGAVVAQTAPQCFDISMWQLVSALLVGGRTHIVEQDVVLDVGRFVETIATGDVNVVQLVPSYLEAVLTHLERSPHPLPALSCLSATGEALKLELVERWFAARPGVRLVNAYGLTETSDDTNHGVMTEVPAHGRVPLGPAIRNVRVYVVDEHLAPVPLGAPGEIVFSGVCVGRGYINDPERTALAFGEDPHRPGERLYRSGDHGCWLPDGSLGFLGRKDSQVKIRGFRIEIGEIENTLLRMPGVRDGAVVVAERAGAGPQLVAFYTAGAEIPVEDLQRHLAAALPEYMVPGVFQHLDALPLTGNSKIDKKALTALAGEAGARPVQVRELGSDTERRLAAAWSGVLGVPADRLGPDDDFFDRGGSSLSAVKVVIALERAVSLNEVIRHPVLHDLAALLDERTP